MSEEITKNLFIKKMRNAGISHDMNVPLNNITWFKEDSYKANDELSSLLKNSSKKLTQKKGTPDFTILIDNNIVVVVECKELVKEHCEQDNIEKITLNVNNIEKYACEGALHYASFLRNKFNVIAIAVSGINENNFKLTSFYIKKGGDINDYIILENSGFHDTFSSINDYYNLISEKTGVYKASKEEILLELKKYANSINNYLRANSISTSERAGFISAIILALTNKDSKLLEDVTTSIEVGRDIIRENAIKQLSSSLEDIWENKDKLGKLKILALKEYYRKILSQRLLDQKVNVNSEYFVDGDNFLTSCLFSIYKNIIIKLNNSSIKLDIMGTFYTEFLRYAKGDAKDKGIVLTPKHITELFCDLAEFYLNKELDENTKVIDICCGTGGFLIAALNRMQSNINMQAISLSERMRKLDAIKNTCLIGVEKEADMFALSYANMRFHGDGKSNLYVASSLEKDKSELDKNVLLSDILKCQNIDIGMINPPYSLMNIKNKKKSNSDGEVQDGNTELDFVLSMLNILKKDGIGIAIVPTSSAGNKGKKLRESILDKHSLLAVMTMPQNLFYDSKVGTTTCIMVFRAGTPHSKSKQPTFLARWTNDGFLTIPHSGRVDKNGAWLDIKNNWLNQLSGSENSDDSKFVFKKLNAKNEALSEAYIKTNLNEMVNESNFLKVIRDYGFYKYLGNNFELNNSELINKSFSFSRENMEFINEIYNDLDFTNWRPYQIKDLFDIETGKDLIYSNLSDGEYFVVGQGKSFNGYAAFTTKLDNTYTLYDCNSTLSLAHIGNFFSTIQENDFYLGTRVKALKSRFECFGKNYEKYKNKYVLAFISAMINVEEFRFNYGRVGSDKVPELEIYLPATNHKCNLTYSYKKTKTSKSIRNINKEMFIPDFEFMENFIRNIDSKGWLAE